MSEAAGLDNLSGCFLKDGAKVLAKPITDLCNPLITSKRFLDSYKISKLKPLHKTVSLTETSNYRPISFLPLISKGIKKVIHYQTSISYLQKSSTIITLVFVKNYSINFCPSFSNEKTLKDFNKSLITGMIHKIGMTDLQKAFDTIDHDLLLVSQNIP